MLTSCTHTNPAPGLGPLHPWFQSLPVRCSSGLLGLLVPSTSHGNSIYSGASQTLRSPENETLLLTLPIPGTQTAHHPEPGEERSEPPSTPMPHRAARQEGSEAGRVLRSPGPGGRRVPSDAPTDPTPTHRPRRSQLHTKTQCGEADPDRRQPGNMAESAQRLAGGEGSVAGTAPSDGTGARLPRPRGRGARAARRPRQPQSPACAPAWPGLPGFTIPAALPLPPVYYAGRDCKSLRAFITRWDQMERHFLAEEVKDECFIGRTAVIIWGGISSQDPDSPPSGQRAGLGADAAGAGLARSSPSLLAAPPEGATRLSPRQPS